MVHDDQQEEKGIPGTDAIHRLMAVDFGVWTRSREISTPLTFSKPSIQRSE